MTGYKAIIRNMTIKQVEDFIHERTGEYHFIDEKEVELSTDNKELGLPDFTIKTTLYSANNSYLPRDYEIHGYINEFGRAHITLVQFSRTYCKRLEDGSFGKERTENFFIYQEELDTFKFDK